MNLAKFAFLYKSSMLALKNVNGGKEQSAHPFMAGLFGGYWVFGHGKGASSSVNQQIVIYVFARVVLAMAKLAVQPPGDNALVGGSYGGRGGKGFLGLSEQQLEMVRRNSWPVFASMSWASVMWLFRWHPDTLQASLRSSMTYMYVVAFLPLAPRPSIRHFRFLGTDTGLTDGCWGVDMIMPISGMAHEISFGIINETHLGHHLYFFYSVVQRSFRVSCAALHGLTACSFANSEHWHSMDTFVYQHTLPALPGIPAKVD
jgi:hypothetical protein